ncbi:hypothetical protein MIR68_009835 [Amoeboaphelidium protococcarum]|nr:hypothetical protein MIR68_009835 [Amoeboaphelidium protococcarum]
MTKRTGLEIMKFAVYVFLPIGVMAISSSQFFQNEYVKPYTLFPSARSSVVTVGASQNEDGSHNRALNEVDDMELMSMPYPVGNETKEEWMERMERTKHLRQRAQEIYHRKKAEQQSDKVTSE